MSRSRESHQTGSTGRETLVRARRVVVKIGTAALTAGDGSLDRAFMHDLASEIAQVRARGVHIILVSSGAVGAGLVPLGHTSRPTDLTELQAAAAVGQPLLMAMWREAFAVRSMGVAQVLLNRGDFDSRERYLNIRNCVACLQQHDVLPIINENDSVATEEISLGDNDVLAAKLAVAVGADALVLLTTVDGIEDGDGSVISELRSPAEAIEHIRSETSLLGRGGMQTKVEAARICGLGGMATIIAGARPAHQLRGIFRGERVGTCVHASETQHAGKRQWIALSATPAGELRVDVGAVQAIQNRGASLLAKGIESVSGTFAIGDVVRVLDGNGTELGRGLSNLSSDELKRVIGSDSSEFESILGRRAHEEVIHRDNLTLTV